MPAASQNKSDIVAQRRRERKETSYFPTFLLSYVLTFFIMSRRDTEYAMNKCQMTKIQVKIQN